MFLTNMHEQIIIGMQLFAEELTNQRVTNKKVKIIIGCKLTFAIFVPLGHVGQPS